MAFPRLDPGAFADAPVVRIWRHRNFALFMSGIGPFYVTGWIQRIAIGWLAWELSRSPGWLGAVAMGELAPMLLISPFAGALVDRWDPVKQLKLALGCMLLSSGLMATVTMAGFMTIELLFTLSLVNGAIISIYNAARQTTVPSTVPRSDFPSAVSLDSATFHGSRFIGPIIAAIIIKQFGVGSAFLVHVLGCGFFLLQAFRISVPPPQRKASGKNVFRDVAAGLRYVRGHSGIFFLFLSLAIVSTVARPLQDFLPGFADVVFKSGVDGLAWLASSMGVGAMSAAAWMALRGHTRGMVRIVVTSVLTMAVALAGVVATENIWLGGVFAALAGFALTAMATGTAALTQLAVSDDMRGRVMSLYAMLYRGLPAFGTLTIGLAAESAGLRIAFGVAAGLCLITWLAVLPRAAEAERRMREPRSNA